MPGTTDREDLMLGLILSLVSIALWVIAFASLWTAHWQEGYMALWIVTMIIGMATTIASSILLYKSYEKL